MPSSPSYEVLVENAPVGVFQVAIEETPGDTSSDWELLYANETLLDILAFGSRDDLHAKETPIEFDDSAERERLLSRLGESDHVESFETALVTKYDDSIDVLLSGTLRDGEFTGYVTDITERKHLERKAEEQAEAILEQSIPVVKIWDGITLATVVGTLDTNRAQRFTEELLTDLTQHQSDIALIDITGVPSVDTATAQHLIDTVNAVSLLGSEVIITGINPEIAQTLVQLGSPMNDIRTKSSLSEGLEHGLRLIEDDAPVPTKPE